MIYILNICLDYPNPGDRDLYNGIQEINKNNYQTALKYFEKASNYHNEYASLFVAVFYFTGFGLLKRDSRKAFELLKKVASDWDNCVAQYLLGLMYVEGDEYVPKDEKTGIHWLLLSAKKGWSGAMAHLAIAYNTIEKDSKKAAEWFEKVAKKDDNDMNAIDDGTIYLFDNKMLELDMTLASKEVIDDIWFDTNAAIISPLQSSRGINKVKRVIEYPEIDRAILWELLTDKKSSNVTMCQLALATIYLEGTNNMPKNNDNFLYWIRKSAKNKNTTACTALGLAYENGKNGVKQDFKEALNWYDLALDYGGDIDAVCHIGILYFNGWGVKKDHRAALQYFDDTVLQNNHGEAYYFMGEIYRLGNDGIPLNYKKSFTCYSKAFEYGCPRGATSIGFLYRRGLGVKKDEDKAYRWLTKGASAGSSAAKYTLGLIHFNGYKGKVDLVKALDLFKQADAGEIKEAKSMIKKIEDLSTASNLNK